MANKREELEALLKTKQRATESDEDYAVRVALQVNEVSDDAWASLSEQSQLWVNKIVEIDDLRNQKKPHDPVPLLEASKPNEERAPDKKNAKKDKEKGGGKTDKKGKKEKPATAKKADKKSEGARGRGRPGKYSPDATVHLLTKDGENPKRKGTAAYKAFAKYKNGMTVAEALKAGVRNNDLRWDAEHKFIEIKASKK